MKKKKVIVVMPAYNAAKTLARTYKDIPKGLAREVILVDDGSSDSTIKKAKKLGLTVYIHENNQGYGANQKTCYKEALKRNPDVVVMIHPDYQYDSTLLFDLIKPILNERQDIMLGSRIRTRKEALSGGMPLYKYISNRFLTLVENIVLGTNLSEFHTGFRAYDKKVLKSLRFEKFSNDFVFDQQMLICALYLNFKIGEIPVPVRYFPEASSINFYRSIIYGCSTIWVLIEYVFKKGIKGKVNIFRKFFAFLILLWFLLSLARMGNNILRIFTEEAVFIHLSDSQKKEKIFGDAYNFWSLIERNTLPSSKIAVFMPDPTMEPGAFYFSIYNLYPRRITYIEDIDLKRLQSSGFNYLVLLYDSKNEFPPALKGKNIGLLNKYRGKNLSGDLIKL